MNTMPTLLSTVILLPLAAAGLSWLARSRASRQVLGTLTGGSLMLLAVALYGQGSGSFSPPPIWDTVIRAADYLLLLIVLGVAIHLRSRLSQFFILLQLALLGWFEFGLIAAPAAGPRFAADALSLLMALVVNGAGGLILVYAPAYIDRHETHSAGTQTDRPQRSFLFFMITFLGAMNGLIFTDDVLWLFFFWELTTVCSFALIAHDRSRISLQNALRALWMTMLGGAALLAGLMLVYLETQSLSLLRIVESPASGRYLLGVAFLCLAGFTKAAQVPFQQWLIGAMVAPAPVSALLHSSTMVKAGAFLILRLMPAFQETFLAAGVAWVGAFSFLTMGALAVSRNDSKQILAYSTILNLGLIIACAGFGRSEAAAAAVLLLVFHAVAKALLFLCVGAVELRTGRRRLDDLQGLGVRMPLTTGFMVIGILSLLLPPFGVVAGKWLMLKAAAVHPFILFALALGMAFHILLYARWAGDLLSGPQTASQKVRDWRPWPMSLSMMALTLAMIVMTPLMAGFYFHFVSPVLAALELPRAVAETADPFSGRGAFPIALWAAALGAAALAAAMISRHLAPKTGCKPPYACGSQALLDGRPAYKGPFNRVEVHRVGPYYFARLFQHKALTGLINAAAILILVIIFTGSAWMWGGLP